MEAPVASFRDPDGSLIRLGQNIFRWLREDNPVLSIEGAAAQIVRAAQSEGAWIHSESAGPKARAELLAAGFPPPGPDYALLSHPSIWFPSYPSEWCPSMLADAGRLTLDLALKLLEADFELKDGTPANVLYEGSRPVFVDHASVAPRLPGALGWHAYGQFSRAFVIPLLLHQLRGLPLAMAFLPRRDGIPPELASRLLGISKFLHPVALTHVVLPAWLVKRNRMRPATQARTSDHGKTITRSILQQLSKQLTKLISSAAGTSDWSTYQHTPSSYSEDESATKLRAVASALDTMQPTRVLDLGTNLGHHAFLAAERGARVVAVDSDAASIEQLYRRAKDLRADILPLVLDLGRPTPSTGWNLSEERSWQSRAEGKFDLVMMLALIHHLLVIERIPLAEILRLASRLTRKHLLIEWVDPGDDHFQRIAGPNLPLYRDLDAAKFEAAATEHFDIISRVPLKGGLRCLYGMTRRHPS